MSSSLFAQENFATQLKKQQYNKAWNTLVAQKSNDSILLKKIEFALTYFSKTKMHQSFAFSDLKLNENLAEIINSEDWSNFKFSKFPIDTLLNKAIDKSPKNGKLHLALGDYYYDIFIRYKDDWLVNKQELMRLFSNSYDKAHQLGDTSYISCYGLGYFNQFKGNYAEAIKYFTISHSLNSNFPSSAYQLSFLLYDEYEQNQANDSLLQKSIFYGKEAFNNFTSYNIKEKADLSYQIGNNYSSLNNCDSAIVFYLKSDYLVPNNPDVMHPLLECFLKQNRLKEAKVVASNMLNIEYKNIRVFQAVSDLFKDYQYSSELIGLLNSEIKKDIYDKQRTGYFKLYIATIHIENKDYQNASKVLKDSKADFNICFDPNHLVFKAIESMERSIPQ